MIGLSEVSLQGIRTYSPVIGEHPKRHASFALELILDSQQAANGDSSRASPNNSIIKSH